MQNIVQFQQKCAIKSRTGTVGHYSLIRGTQIAWAKNIKEANGKKVHATAWLFQLAGVKPSSMVHSTDISIQWID